VTFKENEIEPENGKRGALIFTGATAALRGNVTTTAFAAGKFGKRAISQSLNKEFGKDNIHVSGDL
jgi:short-subunit dehydrogenase